MAQNQVSDNLVDARSDFMVSPTDPSLRAGIGTGHFLLPRVPMQTAVAPPSLPPNSFANINQNNLVQVKHHGWQLKRRNSRWCHWVDRMMEIHRHTWSMVGILDSIQATKFRIRKSDDLMFGLVKKWHPETNSFIFQWGEASITLEDVYVLGGFSVTGESIPLSVPSGSQMSAIEDRLLQVRTRINATPSKKVTYSAWTKLFADQNNGFGDIEHVAFLALWLSKFVFPRVSNTVGDHVHAAAIHLANGVRIALAPAVLASLYQDLRNIKGVISRSDPNIPGSSIEIVKSWSPMQLVQTWAWERFPVLAPKPKRISPGNPRLSRWRTLKPKEINGIGGALDEAGEKFVWRPYCKPIANWAYEFYGGNELWVEVEIGREYRFVNFAMFIRHSELVGLESIEQYMPHRVAMQFGMDQDIPGFVPRFNQMPQIAWRHYGRAFLETKLHIPPRFCKPRVTFCYSTWWKKMKEDQMSISELSRDNEEMMDVGEGSGKDR